MSGLVIFSEDAARVEWSDAEQLKLEFGPKAATLACLPREWTPPFALISSKAFGASVAPEQALDALGNDFISRIRKLAGPANTVYVRSSVVGETIWDRGSYESVVVDASAADFKSAAEDEDFKGVNPFQLRVPPLIEAVKQVLASAPNKQIGLVIQSFVQPRARGEFGNLMRVSKTRDQWELSSESAGTTSRVRFNIVSRDQHVRLVVRIFRGDLSRDMHFPDVIRTILERVR
jgi:hypothetical protein